MDTYCKQLHFYSILNRIAPGNCFALELATFGSSNLVSSAPFQVQQKVTRQRLAAIKIATKTRRARRSKAANERELITVLVEGEREDPETSISLLLSLRGLPSLPLNLVVIAVQAP